MRRNRPFFGAGGGAFAAFWSALAAAWGRRAPWRRPRPGSRRRSERPQRALPRRVPAGDLGRAGKRPAVQPADLDRLRAGDECLHLRARDNRVVASAPVAGSTRAITIPSGGSNGAHVAVLPVLVSPLHELGPDRQGGMRALDVQFLVIVEPHPHHADELRGESGEPAVVRRPGLARRRQRESARRARPRRCRCAAPPAAGPPSGRRPGGRAPGW